MWRSLVPTLALAALTACLAPPAVLPSPARPLHEALARYPATAEVVTLTAEDGRVLRGVYVPADPGAPLVLHLLDSGSSWGGALVELGELCAQLADLGLASLAVDYSGVGQSDGRRSVGNLGADTALAWREALRRVDGDERRVLVRGISLGTIAAAELLDTGARPAAVVLVAPVLPDTVVERFARAAHGRLLAWVAHVLFRPVSELDVAGVFARSGVPVTVLASTEDELSGEDERAELARAARASGGEMHPLSDAHIVVAARARWLFAEELPLYRELGKPDVEARLARTLAELPPAIAARFPAGSEARARLAGLCAWQRETPALWVAAAAWHDGDAEAAARELWLVRRRPYEDMRRRSREPLDFEDLAGRLSLADPAGALPIDALETASSVGDLCARYSGLHFYMFGSGLTRMAQKHGLGYSSLSTASLSNGLEGEFGLDTEALWQEVRAPLTSDADAERQLARIVLRAQRTPERLVPLPRGAFDVAYQSGGIWNQLGLAP